jgi:NADP-dependent 3-hydroxy acid dehydrogenase YdfG
VIDHKKHNEDALKYAANLTDAQSGLTAEQRCEFITGALSSCSAYVVQLIADATAKDLLITRLCERIEKLEAMIHVETSH